MWQQFKKYIVGLMYENDQPCRTGLAGLVLWFIPISVWTFVTIYLVVTGKTFEYYDTLTLATCASCGGGSITILGNKITDSVYNSPKGQFPDESGGK